MKSYITSLFFAVALISVEPGLLAEPPKGKNANGPVRAMTWTTSQTRFGMVPGLNLRITVKNTSGKDIQMIQGVIRFSDPLGNLMFEKRIPVDTKVKAGESFVVDDPINLLDQGESFKRIQTLPKQQILVTAQIQKALFTDGSLFNATR